jgi:hypothetical protein
MPSNRDRRPILKKSSNKSWKKIANFGRKQQILGKKQILEENSKSWKKIANFEEK